MPLRSATAVARHSGTGDRVFRKSPAPQRKLSQPRVFWHSLFAVALLSVFVPLCVNPKMALLYDDERLIAAHRYVAAQDYGKIWTTQYWDGVNQGRKFESLYRPLFLSVVAAFHRWPQALRVLSLVTHAACAVAVGWILWLLLVGLGDRARRFWALCGCAFFAFHPANVEVSAQIVGLMDSWTALTAALSWVLAPSHPLGAFALACLVPGWKETGFLILLVMAVRFWWLGRRDLAAASTACLVLWLALRVGVLGGALRSPGAHFPHVNPLEGASAWDLVWARLAMLGHHVRLFLFPWNLSIDYSRGNLPLPAYPVQIYSLLGIALVALLWKARKPTPGVVWVCLLTVLATLDIERLTAPFAERYGYGLRMGLCLGAFFWLARFLRRPSRRMVEIVIVVLALFLVRTSLRHWDWRSDEALFSRDVARYPMSPKLHYLMAQVHLKNGKIDEGIDELMATLALRDDFPDAHYDLGMLLKGAGFVEKAQAHLELAKKHGYPIP